MSKSETGTKALNIQIFINEWYTPTKTKTTKQQDKDPRFTLKTVTCNQNSLNTQMSNYTSLLSPRRQRYCECFIYDNIFLIIVINIISHSYYTIQKLKANSFTSELLKTNLLPIKIYRNISEISYYRCIHMH